MRIKNREASVDPREELECLVHDLRSALSRIQASADVLQECADSLDSSETSRFLGAILAGTERADELTQCLRERALETL